MAMSVMYTTVNGILLHENRGGVETEYTSDPLGNLIQCRDSAGTKTYEAHYWPYGELRTETGTNPSPWGFVGLLGYLRDAVTLLYVRARYYRPVLSRWQTVDPLWPGESEYGYVANAPAALRDPFGLAPDIIFDACLGFLCSSVDVILKFLDIIGIKNIPDSLKEIAMQLIKDKAEDSVIDYVCPPARDCIKDARKSNPASALAKLVRFICSWIKDDKHVSGFCYALYKGEDDAKCQACCEKYFYGVFMQKCKDRCTGPEH